MKRFIVLIILPIILLIACKSRSGPWGKNKFNDTLSVHAVPYEVLLDKQMDSAEQTAFLSDYCIRKLNGHKGENQFYTQAVFDGDTTKIQFYKGNLCCGEKQHAIAGIQNRNIFFFFLKNNDWQLKQVIKGYGIIKDDSAVQFRDVNFDGFNDVAIIWNYSTGSCNCSGQGCRDIYLYKNDSDSLVHVPEIRSYFDFGISNEEKAIYLGEHCKGLYGKYVWQDGKLQIQEEYTSNQWSETDSAKWKLEHFIYCDGQKIPAYTIPNLPLPEKWRQQFGW